MIIGRSRSIATVLAALKGRGVAMTLAFGLVAATAPAVADGAITGPAGAWYDRSLVVAADKTCGLFEPDVRSALEAATFQARGAAARAGTSDADLALIQGRARAAAAAVACADPDLAVVQGRIVSAYSAWAGMRRMSFAGDRATWRANRTRFPDGGWRLMQDARMAGANAAFGLAVEPGGATAPRAVVSFVGQSRPYAARLVLRDVERETHPRLIDAAGGSRRGDLPPSDARRVVFASGSAQATPDLLAEDRAQGEVWTFPDTVMDALSALDPREPFVIEFLFRDDSVARARFEAGDLAAGRAFVGMGPV